MAEKLNTAVLIPLIWIICNFKSTASQNAQLSVIPETVPVGGAITLTCHYIGTQDETAVFWFNGSNSSPLTLTPASASDGPDCNVFAIVTATYDLSRLRYTCDRKSNTYTLKIDPVQTVDDNVTWSCSFPDPVPDSNRAKHTIHVHLGETSGDSGAGVIEVSTVLLITATAASALISMGVIIFICICKKMRWKVKKRVDAYHHAKIMQSSVDLRRQKSTELAGKK